MSEGTLVSFGDKYASVQDLLAEEGMQRQLKLALPRHVDPGRLARLVLTECRRIPGLLDCSRESLLGGVMEAAQLGLDIGTRGHAWLIPYKVKGVKTATLIVGYRGMLDLAWRSDKIKSVYAHEVCEGDDFAYQFGTAQFIRHIPAEKSERGEITHAYSGCTTHLDGQIMDVMDVADIEKIREGSRSKDKGPWVTHYAEQCKKTTLRRMLKLAPCSVELQHAITLDEQADAGIPQGLDDAIDITPPTDPEGVTTGTETEPNGD